jgi:hypothetical protein
MFQERLKGNGGVGKLNLSVACVLCRGVARRDERTIGGANVVSRGGTVKWLNYGAAVDGAGVKGVALAERPRGEGGRPPGASGYWGGNPSLVTDLFSPLL